MRILAIDILATMRLISVPDDTYFLLHVDVTPDCVYYKDYKGDYFAIDNYGKNMESIKSPCNDDDIVFIVNGEIVNSIKGYNYDNDPSYFDDVTEFNSQYDPYELHNDPYEDVYNQTVEQLYDEGNY